MLNINEKLSGKIHDDVLSSLRKDGAVYDSVEDTFEYTKMTHFVNLSGILVEKKSKYKCSVEEIRNEIDNVEDFYKKVNILYQNGVTLDNAKNMLEEVNKHPECLDIYNSIYSTYPDTKSGKLPTNTEIWNNLVTNGYVDNTLNYEDTTKFYKSMYRLIKLVEINAPDIMIKNEMKTLTINSLNLSCYRGLDKTNEYNKQNEDLER